MQWANQNKGFTIVELLIVIVVIAILAAITIVAYNGIADRAEESAIKSELRQLSQKIVMHKEESGAYPSSLAGANLPDSSQSAEYTYSAESEEYCLSAQSLRTPTRALKITHTGEVSTGSCPPMLVYIQAITNANCPTSRTIVTDARDNHSYWIQKLADGKCWMLTNLAYAGGGANTYSDVKSLSNGTGEAAWQLSNTVAKYYIVDSSNPTTYPDRASTSTDGGQTDTQHGYLYNWCAAMGVQTGTAACDATETPLPDMSVSVCPANWRLPTGGEGGELEALNTGINGGASNSDNGLRMTWLNQYGGYWYGSHYSYGSGVGNAGHYWSSGLSSGYMAKSFSVGANWIETDVDREKGRGQAVRCVAI